MAAAAPARARRLRGKGVAPSATRARHIPSRGAGNPNPNPHPKLSLTLNPNPKLSLTLNPNPKLSLSLTLSVPLPLTRARVHGARASLPSGGGGMYAPAGYLGGEHAGLFNMNRPFAAAPFRSAPPLNPLAAPAWSVPPLSAPSARDAASALDAVSSRWSRAAGGVGAGAGAGMGVGVGALPPAAADGGGFPSGGPSTNGFLWEPITVQDESGAPQTLFEGPTVEDGLAADMPLPPTLDLFDLFAM